MEMNISVFLSYFY